jgi:acetyl-CoA carboxylase biotin carboxyl carrier protein
MINLDWIRQLIDLIDESDVDSIEIARFGKRVRISKSPPIYLGSAGVQAPVAAGAPAGHASPSPSAAPASSAEPGPAESDPASEVVSPMVGTFYGAPAPDAPPYVEVGDTIRKGQTLCILEAMKLMNELEAEVGGTIREICVGNGDPVEYGQVLFRIEPND